jgi:hypothetical protein
MSAEDGGDVMFGFVRAAFEVGYAMGASDRHHGRLTGVLASEEIRAAGREAWNEHMAANPVLAQTIRTAGKAL